MRRFNLLVVILFGLIVLPMAREAVRAAVTPPSEIERLLAEADAMRAEKSFAIAREKYAAVLELEGLSDDHRNRAEVWLADVSWREGDGASERKRPRRPRRPHTTQPADPGVQLEPLHPSETELQRLVEDLPASDLRAEAAESLGDLRSERGGWDPKRLDKAVEAWIIALKHWEEAKNLDVARPRYVALNFKIADSAQNRGGIMPYPRTPLLDQMQIWPPQPPDTPEYKQDTATWALRNVLRVSQDPADRTRALFMLGQLRSRIWTDDKAWIQEGLEALKQAIAIEPRNEWTDDAWFELGQAHQRQQDLVQALATFQDFIKAYGPGESQFHDSAKNIIQQITQLEANISNPQNFAEGSFLNITLNYKNLDRATLRVSRIEIDKFIETLGTRGERGFNLSDDEFPEISGTVVYDEVLKTTNANDYKHQQVATFIEPQPLGVYQATLTSEGNGEKRRVQRVFLVSRLAVAAKLEEGKVRTFVTDADTGQVVSGAALTIFQYKREWDGNPPILTRLTGETNTEGIAETACPLPDEKHRQIQYLIVARKGDQIAFLQDQAYSNYRGPEQTQFQPQLFLITDRPAYRPNELVHWKAILRSTDGRDYQLPSYKKVWAEIRDERGDVIASAPHALNEFGTLEGSFTPTDKTPLGMMSLSLRLSENGDVIAGNQLARLEEYKLPEYIVSVTPGAEQVRFGGKVPFTIDAQYYFGGPVAGAEVTVVVHRQPFRQGWNWPLPYPWLWEGVRPMRGGLSARSSFGFRPWPPHEPEVTILETKLTTDAEGKAKLEIGELTAEEIKAAEEQGYWGYSYRVEARVVDSSRREVIGNGTIKVARTAFAAYLTTERYLYLPGDKIKLTLKTLDPNDQPLPAEGLVTVYRRKYNENKDNGKHPQNGHPLPKGGYDDTELFTKPAVTPATGETAIEFDIPEEGVYLARFNTKDAFGADVEGETTFFVAAENTQQLGYRSGGVEIITDKTSYERGETASVLITTRRPGVSVWFGVEGETTHQAQVLQLTGSVQLVPVKITEDMEPNIYFTAVAMYDYSAFSEQKRIVVPPARRYLDVTLEADRTDYQPGEKAELRLTVKDSEGEPVAADFALGVADASVWAIGGETSGDIRQAFWSATRGLNIQTIASPMQWTTQFWKPIKDKPGEYELVMREAIPEYDPRLGTLSEGDVVRYREERNLGWGNQIINSRFKAADAVMAESAPMELSDGYFATGAMSIAPASAPAVEEPRLRTDFSSTALWIGQLITGADGKGTAQVTWPDSLTTWNAIARGIDTGSRVGETRIAFKTNKPIMVRPQAPRFFVQGDRATLSAIVNNTTSQTQLMQVRLDLTGLALTDPTTPTQAGDTSADASTPVATRETALSVRVPAGSQRRIDWTATADAPGTATVRITIKNENDGDAVEKTYPILEYGIEKQIDAGLKLAGPDQTLAQTISLEVPAARREGTEALTILVEPTLALTMVNALDYLARYPYGCVEQTLSRFVPAVITKQTLDRLNIRKPSLEAELPALIDAGLKRLYDFQHEDGGWSWWKEGAGDLYMSAYVVQGLAQAEAAGVAVSPSVLQRGAEFLRLALVKAEDQPDLAAFMLYAITSVSGIDVNDPMIVKAFERVYAGREKLNPYTRALLTLACHAAGRAEWTATLARNLRNNVTHDAANGTASWGTAGVAWRWSDNGIEATAFTLRALLVADPQNELIEPAMTWLTRNRKGNRWENTRDTAIAISALADYIKVRGEDQPNWNATVKVNGEVVSTLNVTPQSLFDFNGEIKVPAAKLRTGANEIAIERTGSGVLYASAWMTFFTREKPIKADGYEIYVTRKYFRTSTHATLGGVVKQEREEIAEGTPLTSGDRVEVELTVESKNNYEYLVLEDPKPAGMEPTVLQSGWDWGGGMGAHREFRDQRTAFFFNHLSQGTHVITYELRAEIPGLFQALPSQIHAMYVPEIRGNADSRELAIQDKP